MWTFKILRLWHYAEIIFNSAFVGKMPSKSNKNSLWNNVLKKNSFYMKYTVKHYNDRILCARLFPLGMIQGEKHVFFIIQTFIATNYPKIFVLSFFFYTAIATNNFEVNKPIFKSQHSTYNISFCGRECVGTHRSPLAFIMYF